MSAQELAIWTPGKRLAGIGIAMHAMLALCAALSNGLTGFVLWRRDGAVLAILVFDVERIAAQAGTTGVNEMFICLAGRIQRQVGVVNPVGRYYERCFVSLQRMAQAARGMRSRAAILDPATGEVVPVEQAHLGPRRHGHAHLVPHAL